MNAGKSFNIAIAQTRKTKLQISMETGYTPNHLSVLSSKKEWSGKALVKVSKALGMTVSEFIKLGEA